MFYDGTSVVGIKLTMTKNSLGKILIASAALLVLFVIGRGIYYSPSKELTQEIETPELADGTPIDSTPEEKLPTRLSIPKLEVDAYVERLGITATGNMASPNGFSNVSWYKYGTIPGATGSAVMAGHDNGIYVPGVFRRLNEMRIGDDVYVVSENGKQLHFRVTDIEVYPYDEAPLERIFNTTDKSRLNLITCTGEWLPNLKMSDQRLVVYTELVES